MTTRIALGLIALAAPLALAFAAMAHTTAPRPAKPLAHMVFFTVKDRTEANRQALADSCHKYLSDHPGVLYFSVGTIAEDVVEPVSVRDWDVALHLVFESKEAADTYQKSERHQKFVAENRESFGKVRVFDSYLGGQ